MELFDAFFKKEKIVVSMNRIKEVYDRIGINEARAPIAKFLPNDSNMLDLVEFWPGGCTEGHLFIQKNGNKYILYEIIHNFNSKSETVYNYTIKNTDNLQSVIKEIEKFCKIRYDGTLKFDFMKMVQNEDVRHFFGM